MNVASLELCKELFELSGWRNASDQYIQMNDPDAPIELRSGYDNLSELGNYSFSEISPAYDLGYLLRKLPYLTLTNDYERGTWYCGEYGWYDDIGWIERVEADTPEDAACKLAIELFKQKLLTA